MFAYTNYLEDIRILREVFNHFVIIHMSKTQNIRVDSLPRSTWKQSLFVVHMDAELSN